MSNRSLIHSRTIRIKLTFFSFQTEQNTSYQATWRTKKDPPPTVFTLALSLFALSLLYTHHLHRHHRFQNHFLTIGMYVGVMVSSIRTLLIPAHSLVTELQAFVPWTIVIASAASAMVHWSVGGERMILRQDGDVGVRVDGRERKSGKRDDCSGRGEKVSLSGENPPSVEFRLRSKKSWEQETDLRCFLCWHLSQPLILVEYSFSCPFGFTLSICSRRCYANHRCSPQPLPQSAMLSKKKGNTHTALNLLKSHLSHNHPVATVLDTVSH